MKSKNNNNDDDDDDDNNNNTAMGSVHARGDTFLTFGLKALTETNTSRLATAVTPLPLITLFCFLASPNFLTYFAPPDPGTRYSILTSLPPWYGRQVSGIKTNDGQLVSD
jgi:hypothetical protein